MRVYLNYLKVIIITEISKSKWFLLGFVFGQKNENDLQSFLMKISLNSADRRRSLYQPHQSTREIKIR